MHSECATQARKSSLRERERERSYEPWRAGGGKAVGPTDAVDLLNGGDEETRASRGSVFVHMQCTFEGNWTERTGLLAPNLSVHDIIEGHAVRLYPVPVVV